MPKRAVVLAGGGARGPYQIGVWQALRELGVEYDIVCGTSVGALNGALMVQGDFEIAREMWLTVTNRDIVALPERLDPGSGAGRRALAGYLRDVVRQGGMDVSPLESLMRRVVDEERLRASPIRYGLVTVRFPSWQPERLSEEEIPAGRLIDYMLASASYFPFFRLRSIDGKRYMDGAMADGIPAQLALRCGAEELIAIDLAGLGVVRRLRQHCPLTYIRSYWNLGQILRFEPENAKRSLALGYLDGLKAYRRLEGCAYAFPLGETARNAARLRPVLWEIRDRSGVSLFRQYQQIPNIQEALRYRDRRFVHHIPERHSLGSAVTAAAEIAAELLGVEPDRVWRFEELNDELRRRGTFLRTPVRGRPIEGPVPERMRRSYSRFLLHSLFSMLESACGRGAVHETFWGLVAAGAREFIAAYYMLAVFLDAARPDG